jgi:hypothetical protein
LACRGFETGLRPSSTNGPGLLDEPDSFGEGEAEAAGGGDEVPGRVRGVGRRTGRGRGDEGAAAALGGDDAVGLELAVGAGDGVDREVELGGQRPDGRGRVPAGRSSDAARVAIWARSCSYGGSAEVASSG